MAIVALLREPGWRLAKTKDRAKNDPGQLVRRVYGDTTNFYSAKVLSKVKKRLVQGAKRSGFGCGAALCFVNFGEILDATKARMSLPFVKYGLTRRGSDPLKEGIVEVQRLAALQVHEWHYPPEVFGGVRVLLAQR